MTGPRILVVEDEEIIALHLKEQLTELGYEVPATVASGDHALRQIEEAPPDLILMDINIKGQLDGIATAAAIPPRYRIPVIYLTAYSGDETLARAAATNPYGYLVKPFVERELHAMIQVTLARCQAERSSSAALEKRQQAAKMKALSLFAGGLADEVDDLLSVLYDQLEMLGGHALADPALAEPVRDAFDSAIEKERLVKRLLDFAGRRPLSPSSVFVDELVNRATGQLRHVLGDTVRVRMRLAPDLWPVRIDAGQLVLSLTNLITNAREAMPNGGEVTIEGENVTLDSADATRGTDASPGRYVLLSVSDTGSGMAEFVIDRAFEPFFTTKSNGGATGFGLSLVFAFIWRSGGHISVDSKPANGTTVRLYLPAGSRDGVFGSLAAAVPPWPSEHPPIKETHDARPKAGVGRQNGRARARRVPRGNERSGGAAAVLWDQAGNTLFASVSGQPGVHRYRLIVERLPRQNGWDWEVWRSGDSEELSRHGRASSVVSAMAAAEDAARHWHDAGRGPECG